MDPVAPKPGRKLRRIFGAMALLAGGAIAAIVVVNLFDEALKPEARDYFAKGVPAPFSPDAGFALIVGFNAPAGEDPRQYARRRFADAEHLALGELEVGESSRALGLRAADELLCGPESDDCASLFKVRPESIADLASDNATLLDRYDALQRAPRLRETGIATETQLSLYFAPIKTIFGVQRVRLSQIAVLVSAGKVDDALGRLESDTRFYRRWLSETATILGKMVALRGLMRDLLIAAQIDRARPDLTAAQREALLRIASPLGPEERALAPAIRHEAALFVVGIDRVIANPRRTSQEKGMRTPFFPQLVSLTIRRNATLNRGHPIFEALERVDAIDGRDFSASFEGVRSVARRQVARDWSSVYNFTGLKILEELGAEDFAAYFIRIRDVETLAALVSCVATVRSSRVPPERIGEVLVRSVGPCANPQTGKPFEWDAAERRLWFKPGNEPNVSRMGGAAGRVALSPF